MTDKDLKTLVTTYILTGGSIAALCMLLALWSLAHGGLK